ncbi:MAG TPA: VWA domain-containing protein [Blastocatellia bacterium]|nr:VWA domain-containing protein [Blastocatellia bacterium]
MFRRLSILVVSLASLSTAALTAGASRSNSSLSASRPAASSQKADHKKNDQEGNKDTPQKLGVLTVRLPIVVKKNNKFVGGLSRANFEIFEDGKLQKIEEFQAPSDLPLDVAILMDTSESVKLKLPFEKSAAEDFVSDITTYRRRDRVLFATFDTDIELHQDFTAIEGPLVRAINSVKAGGYTRLYDAVCRVIEEKMSNLARADSRGVILILSDGEDTASQHSVNDAVEMAERYDVTVFAISTKNFTGITSGIVESVDDKELRHLCEETGGQIFLPAQKLELFRSFTQVATDLRGEYVAFYTPDDQKQAGKHRTIKVKLVGADGKLYHKQGYKY